MLASAAPGPPAAASAAPASATATAAITPPWTASASSPARIPPAAVYSVVARIAIAAAATPGTPRKLSPRTAAALAWTAPEATQPITTTSAAAARAARPNRAPISSVGVSAPWRRANSTTGSPITRHCRAPVSGADSTIHSEPAPVRRNSPGPPT